MGSARTEELVEVLGTGQSGKGAPSAISARAWANATAGRSDGFNGARSDKYAENAERKPATDCPEGGLGAWPGAVAAAVDRVSQGGISPLTRRRSDLRGPLLSLHRSGASPSSTWSRPAGEGNCRPWAPLMRETGLPEFAARRRRAIVFAMVADARRHPAWTACV